jgi:hypothetical protein
MPWWVIGVLLFCIVVLVMGLLDDGPGPDVPFP